MNYNIRVVFDIKRCAFLGVSAEAVQFWDRGNGAKFLENLLADYLCFLNVNDLLELENWYCERDIYKDFSTNIFRIKEKKLRVLGNDKQFLQVKLEPVSEQE